VSRRAYVHGIRARQCYGAARMSTQYSLDENLMKALAHPLRWRILEVVAERGEASPVELARTLGQPLATVSHHVRVLRETGSLELTRTEQRRGALEHFYRALIPTFFDSEQWDRAPIVLRRSVAGQIFQRIVGEAAAAGAGGAFDSPHAHLDRMIVELDDEGWQELSDFLVDVLKHAQAIQARSDARRDDKRPARTAQLAILSFEVAGAVASDGDAHSDTVPKRSQPLT
jgi:DNA-binding transcriptional ArsR family regulator